MNINLSGKDREVSGLEAGPEPKARNPWPIEKIEAVFNAILNPFISRISTGSLAERVDLDLKKFHDIQASSLFYFAREKQNKRFEELKETLKIFSWLPQRLETYDLTSDQEEHIYQKIGEYETGYRPLHSKQANRIMDILRAVNPNGHWRNLSTKSLFKQIVDIRTIDAELQKASAFEFSFAALAFGLVDDNQLKRVALLHKIFSPGINQENQKDYESELVASNPSMQRLYALAFTCNGQLKPMFAKLMKLEVDCHLLANHLELSGEQRRILDTLVHSISQMDIGDDKSTYREVDEKAAIISDFLDFFLERDHFVHWIETHAAHLSDFSKEQQKINLYQIFPFTIIKKHLTRMSEYELIDLSNYELSEDQRFEVAKQITKNRQFLDPYNLETGIQKLHLSPQNNTKIMSICICRLFKNSSSSGFKCLNQLKFFLSNEQILSLAKDLENKNLFKDQPMQPLNDYVYLVMKINPYMDDKIFLKELVDSRLPLFKPIFEKAIKERYLPYYVDYLFNMEMKVQYLATKHGFDLQSERCQLLVHMCNQLIKHREKKELALEILGKFDDKNIFDMWFDNLPKQKGEYIKHCPLPAALLAMGKLNVEEYKACLKGLQTAPVRSAFRKGQTEKILFNFFYSAYQSDMIQHKLIQGLFYKNDEIAARASFFSLLINTPAIIKGIDQESLSQPLTKLQEFFLQPVAKQLKISIESLLKINAQWRDPHALMIYFFKIAEEKRFSGPWRLMDCYRQFIHSLADQSFHKKRYDNSPHLAKLSARLSEKTNDEAASKEILSLWQQGGPKIDILQTANEGEVESTNERGALQAKKKHLTLFDTDDPQDLLLLGAETSGCQSIYGDLEYNKCALGYVVDGKNRAIVIKDPETNKIVARAVIRLLWNETTNEPALFVETCYFSASYSPYYGTHIRKYAKSLAQTLNIGIFEGDIGVFEGDSEPTSHNLKSFGCIAPHEYSDAGTGRTNGFYRISARPLA